MTEVKAAFDANGYAVAPVFEAGRVLGARQGLAAHLDTVGDALLAPAAAAHRGLPIDERLARTAAADKPLARLLQLALCTDGHRTPPLAALAADPALAEAAARLAGGPVDGHLFRVRASVAAFPEAAHDWHSDVALDDGSDCARVRVTAWIPLGDAGPDHGGLEVIRGRNAAPFAHRRTSGFAIPEKALAARRRDAPHCPAGSVLFLDRFTPHRTIPVTQGARFALVVWFKTAAN